MILYSCMLWYRSARDTNICHQKAGTLRISRVEELMPTVLSHREWSVTKCLRATHVKDFKAMPKLSGIFFAFNPYSAEAEATCCLMNSMRSRRPRCADQCMGEKPCSNLSSYPFGWNTILNTKLVEQCAPKDQILRSPNWIRKCLSSGLWRQAFISHMHQHLSVEGIYMKSHVVTA